MLTVWSVARHPQHLPGACAGHPALAPPRTAESESAWWKGLQVVYSREKSEKPYSRNSNGKRKVVCTYLTLRRDFHLLDAANINNLWVTLLPCLFLPYQHVPITTFYLVFFWKLTNFNKFHKRSPLRNHKPDTVVRFFPQYTWTWIWNHKRRGVCIALHSPHTTSVGVPWGPLHKDAPLYLRIICNLGGGNLGRNG